MPDWAQTLAPELRNIAFVERAPWSQTHDLQALPPADRLHSPDAQAP
jgi:hypothetical protein